MIKRDAEIIKFGGFIRKKLGLGDFIKSEAELTDALGKILSVSVSTTSDNNSIIELLADNTILFRIGEEYRIDLNTKKLFVLSHVLGHLLLHSPYAKKATYTPFVFQPSTATWYGHAEIDREADIFALSLIGDYITWACLVKKYSKGDDLDIRSLCAGVDISQIHVKHHLEMLNLIYSDG